MPCSRQLEYGARASFYEIANNLVKRFEKAEILKETTGNRLYAYTRFLDIIAEGTKAEG